MACKHVENYSKWKNNKYPKQRIEIKLMKWKCQRRKKVMRKRALKRVTKNETKIVI